jgi:hypothetical protein
MACNKRPDYETDEIFTATFSEDDIVEINTLIAFVDSVVLSETDDEDINMAYASYLKKLVASMNGWDYIVPINFKDKFSFLEQVEKSTLGEFWYNFTSYYDPKLYPEPYNRFLNINVYGEYVEYMGEVGKSDSMHYYIHDNIMGMRDISSSLVIEFMADSSNIDYHLIKNRLLSMVCIMGIAEPMESPRNR